MVGMQQNMQTLAFVVQHAFVPRSHGIHDIIHLVGRMHCARGVMRQARSCKSHPESGAESAGSKFESCEGRSPGYSLAEHIMPAISNLPLV